MSCRHKYSIPHPDDVCLDCECLAPEKCSAHGPHAEHDVGVVRCGGSNEVVCFTCHLRLSERERLVCPRCSRSDCRKAEVVVWPFRLPAIQCAYCGVILMIPTWLEQAARYTVLLLWDGSVVVHGEDE